MAITDTIIQSSLKKQIPDIQPGDTVRAHQRIKEGNKERVQVFEGVVLARKHGSGINATITVRRVQKGFGVERVFPLHSPVVEKFEIIKRAKVRRAKLYYLRSARGKKARLKARDMGLEVEEPETIMATQEDETSAKAETQENTAREEETAKTSEATEKVRGETEETAEEKKE